VLLLLEQRQALQHLLLSRRVIFILLLLLLLVRLLLVRASARVQQQQCECLVHCLQPAIRRHQLEHSCCSSDSHKLGPVHCLLLQQLLRRRKQPLSNSSRRLGL
jgi:competence protein ComGC